MEDREKKVERMARKIFEELDTWSRLLMVMFIEWLYIRQEARKLYLRLCFPWLGELAQEVRWYRRQPDELR